MAGMRVTRALPATTNCSGAVSSYLWDGLALLKSSAEQSRSGAPAAFLFQQKRDEGVASTRFGTFSTEPDGF
jgi:hypothetical protein